MLNCIFPSTENHECNKNGVCEDSNILGFPIVEDIKACQIACKSKKDCVWFTYYPNQNPKNRLCRLFGGCKTFSTECPRECISSQVSCPFCNEVGKCEGGNMVDLGPAENVHKCLKLCKKNQGCSWISYDSESKFCYQFDNCTSVSTEDNKNYLSSETTCPTYECNKIGFCQVRYTV